MSCHPTMGDWQSLLSPTYNSELAYQDFLAWYHDRTPDKLCKTIESLTPLLSIVVSHQCPWVTGDELDDVCSEVMMAAAKKLQKSPDYFFERMNSAPVYSKCWRTTLVRTLIDYFRRHDKDKGVEFDGKMVHLPSQVAVEVQVDVQLLLEELPQLVTEFALGRDRFGFGKVPILAVVTFLLLNRRTPPEMLRNWYGIKNPDQCISFVVLMCRCYLYERRESLGALLDISSRQMIDEAGSCFRLAAV